MNTAVGGQALFNNIDGQDNTGIGIGALGSNTSGSLNIGLGVQAGANVTTASGVICIGQVPGENINSTCYIANIYSNVQPVIGNDPDYVTIASNGKLGRGGVSSRRYKHDIQPMDKASEVIFALKPVSFRYNKEYDAIQRIAFGLIAEEVAEVAPDLVGRNKNGEPDSVRYEQINAMLLNEFLKEHRRARELEAANAQLRSDAAKQQAAMTQLKKQVEVIVARLEEHDSKIQAVNDQLEISKAAPQTAMNNH